MILTKKVPFTYLLGQIKYDLFWVFCIEMGAELFLYFTSKVIPPMPWSVPAFLGTAISILLSFKMAQSYDRWWEARKIWGAIVNDSRSLILQLFQFCNSMKYTPVMQTIAFYQIAWCYELAHRLTGQTNHQKLTQLLEVDNTEINNIKHLPLWINKKQVEQIKSLRNKQGIDAFAHTQLDDTLTRLVASMGMAERIKNTVFPSSYRYILHLSIYVFLIMLSIAMKDIQLMYHVPLLFIMACIFFMLEKSSFSLQDPFHNHITDVPIFSISENIEGNIMELIGKDFEGTNQYEKGFYQI